MIARSIPKPDLILAKSTSIRDGTPAPEVKWIEDLKERLNGSPDASGAYTLSAAELLGCQAHCHRDTTIVSSEFYSQLHGLDEELRYAEDRDFYLRAIDRARLIKFLPFIVSRHNIPAPGSGQVFPRPSRNYKSGYINCGCSTRRSYWVYGQSCDVMACATVHMS
jgi:hypothetical protein